MPDLKILVGDVREKLRELTAGSVQCIMTSPPYWALRDYGTGEWKGGDPKCKHTPKAGRHGSGQGERVDGSGVSTVKAANYRAPSRKCAHCSAVRVNDSQIGSEPTVEEFYRTMVGVCRELRRVLRDDGTFWLNMGDCYAQDGGSTGEGEYAAAQERARERGYNVGAWGAKSEQGSGARARASGTAGGKLKPKDLVGQAWGLAFALRDDGWYLRSAIVWSKNNPLPESVVDRPAVSHEYVFLLTKSPNYFYDHIAVRSDYALSTLSQLGTTYGGSGKSEAGVQNASDVKRRIIASLGGKSWKATQLGPSKSAKNADGEGGAVGHGHAAL